MSENSANHLTWQQRYTLQYGDGFLRNEIKDFDSNLPDGWWDLEATKRMRKSRRDYIDKLVAAGWTKKEIAARIRSWYKRKELGDAWDIFKWEYARASHRPTVSSLKFQQYLEARRAGAKFFESKKLTDNELRKAALRAGAYPHPDLLVRRQRTNYGELKTGRKPIHNG